MTLGAGERRDTALGRRIAAMIGERGPIPVGEYMTLCLADPSHGYYRARPVIGAGGDFITSPEISQVFGELIGLWAAVVWQAMGAPDPVRLVEVGPGRGTMMADMLRAARIVPAFRAAVRVGLVEPSPILRKAQLDTLAGAGVAIKHAEGLLGLQGPTPLILVANELLDALPAEQAVMDGGCWRRRAVGIGPDGRLCFTHGQDPLPAGLMERLPRSAGEVATLTPAGIVAEIAGLAPRLAALLIDFGHTEPAVGDTLQAVRGHAIEHPLASPGEADLSTAVDFAAIADAARGAGLAVDGPVTQAELLGRLGIIERASRLMAASPQEAAAVEAAVARLMAPAGMGGRFKALGLRSPGLAPLPGLT